MTRKWVHLYNLPEIGKCYAEVRIEGETDRKKLAIFGVEGPQPGGNCRGSCGQCYHGGNVPPDAFNVQPYAAELLWIWDRWHLNDMRSGCEHQRAAKWSERPIDPSKPLNAYGKHFPGQRSASWNMLAWITRTDHPEGLLSEPCPACGYRYGSAWLYEPLPPEVLDFVASLPDHSDDVPPTWRR